MSSFDETFPLQRLCSPLSDAVRPLYFSDNGDLVVQEGGDLLFEAGSKCSFDAYFNSFYESYWLENTDISDLFLEFVLLGCVLIEVYRDFGDGNPSRIFASKIRAPLESIRIPLPLFKSGQLGQSGRLFADFTAITDCRLSGVQYTSSLRPFADTSLTLGICTFNREDFLLRNLSSIDRIWPSISTLRHVVIVNQGASFSNPPLLALLAEQQNYTVVQQRNLGGCGGFTRTMHEVLEHHHPSHHLLMDDDTTLDPQMLANLALFLGYVSRNIIVGGHMLDMLRPCTLYEAGAMLRHDARVQALNHNLDLTQPDALSAFCNAVKVDYNAWWLCAIPAHHMREAGYPAPVFIRGDDMEYGVRLGLRGVRTVAMPGVAVWHEPFYAKPGGWQMYYDLRNRLILAATYPERFSPQSPKKILWVMAQALAVHDYYTASLLALAVKDFLKGPILFDQDAEDTHKHLTSSTRQHDIDPIDRQSATRPSRTRERWQGELRVALGLMVKLGWTLLRGGSRRPSRLLLDVEAHPGNVGAHPYIKTNGVGTYRKSYSPNRRQLANGLVECFKVYRTYRLRRGQVCKQWAENSSSYKSKAWWMGTFGSSI